MSAKTYSAMVREGSGEIVRVETELARGLPYFVMVGLASKDVTEARERVKVAIQNSGLEFPRFRKVVNLSPSNVRKHGSQFDLAIALGILNASKQIVARDWLESSVFVGELTLDGGIRGVRGTLAMVEAAKRVGFKNVFVGMDRVGEACLVEGMRVFAFKNLRDLVSHLKGEKLMNEVKKNFLIPGVRKVDSYIKGHSIVKRALRLAAGFRHHIILIGPPGMGKSVLARSVAGMLPPLAENEIAEVVRVYSSFTNEDFGDGRVLRPFREVAHTISRGSLVGGGVKLQVGEMSLAHKGVLLIDDLHNFSRPQVEAMLKPMEEGKVIVSAGKKKVCLPSDFTMVATMNPCACGHRSVYNQGKCTCREFELNRFMGKIPRAFWDRVDMVVEVPCISEKAEIRSEKMSKKWNVERQHRRLKDSVANFNGEMASGEVQKLCNLSKSANDLLEKAAQKKMVSGRGYFNTIKVARSIADLEDSTKIEPQHISEALSYRKVNS